jgi:hypothetical protein
MQAPASSPPIYGHVVPVRKEWSTSLGSDGGTVRPCSVRDSLGKLSAVSENQPVPAPSRSAIPRFRKIDKIGATVASFARLPESSSKSTYPAQCWLRSRRLAVPKSLLLQGIVRKIGKVCAALASFAPGEVGDRVAPPRPPVYELQRSGPRGRVVSTRSTEATRDIRPEVINATPIAIIRSSKRVRRCRHKSMVVWVIGLSRSLAL